MNKRLRRANRSMYGVGNWGVGIGEGRQEGRRERIGLGEQVDGSGIGGQKTPLLMEHRKENIYNNSKIEVLIVQRVNRTY